MNRPGNQFLAHAGFALQQHTGIGFGHLAHPLQDIQNGIAAPDDLLKVCVEEQFFPELQVFLLQLGFEGFKFLQGRDPVRSRSASFP